MKKSLLLLMGITAFLSADAQYSNSHLLHNNYSIKVNELEKVKPLNPFANQTTSIQRNIIWSEDFSNGIPNNWTFGGYYTNSSSVQIPFPDMTQNPPIYGWEYRGPNTQPDVTTGTRGAYGGNALIISPTVTNGFIIIHIQIIQM